MSVQAVVIDAGHRQRNLLAQVAFCVMAVLIVMVFLMEPAIAQTGGGTGTATAVQARATSVVTGFQAMMYAVGAFILAAAFMYVGYGMAFAGKRWGDVANVAYGSVIAGAGVLLVTWLFL